MSSDTIEKKVVLKAPLQRVWSAVSDSAEFGLWFGMKLDDPFEAGQTVKGTIQQTTVDPEVAATQAPYVGRPVVLDVDQVDPNRLFSFRWHPFAVDAEVDYSSEPTTLVEFLLAESEDGVILTIRESGFDQLAEDRREDAMKSHESGWAGQTRLISKYLTA